MENTYSISYSTPPSLTTWTKASLVTKELRPQKIIYNNRTTVVIWNDGTKTKSTCSENDIFDEYLGFSSCLLKKMYGKKVHGKRLFDRMIEGAERHNGLKDDSRDFYTGPVEGYRNIGSSDTSVHMYKTK